VGYDDKETSHEPIAKRAERSVPDQKSASSAQCTNPITHTHTHKLHVRVSNKGQVLGLERALERAVLHSSNECVLFCVVACYLDALL
jgi:hypothetical protein